MWRWRLGGGEPWQGGLSSWLGPAHTTLRLDLQRTTADEMLQLGHGILSTWQVVSMVNEESMSVSVFSWNYELARISHLAQRLTAPHAIVMSVTGSTN